jgi:AhpC/TSA family
MAVDPDALFYNPREKGGTMSEEMEVGCARPTGGPVGESVEEQETKTASAKKEAKSMIKVGKKAPDFSAPGYHKGRFISMRMSEYLGKWVLLCFYPGDFTFV